MDWNHNIGVYAADETPSTHSGNNKFFRKNKENLENDKELDNFCWNHDIDVFEDLELPRSPLGTNK